MTEYKKLSYAALILAVVLSLWHTHFDGWVFVMLLTLELVLVICALVYLFKGVRDDV